MLPPGCSVFDEKVLTQEDLEALDPHVFEAFCAFLWSKCGYLKTLCTPKFGDGGVDVVPISDKDVVLIQCNSSRLDDRALGWDAVKDVVAGSAGYATMYPGVRFSLAAVTNRRFNRTARHQAKLNHVQLLDGDDLAMLMHEKPVRRAELDRFLFSGW